MFYLEKSILKMIEKNNCPERCKNQINRPITFQRKKQIVVSIMLIFHVQKEKNLIFAPRELDIFCQIKIRVTHFPDTRRDLHNELGYPCWPTSSAFTWSVYFYYFQQSCFGFLTLQEKQNISKLSVKQSRTAHQRLTFAETYK